MDETALHTSLDAMKNTVNQYLTRDVVSDFSLFPVHQKLSLFAQKTPKKYIKERKIGNKKVKYPPYKYPRKVLNFIFNFNVSTEVMKEEYISYKEKMNEYENGKSTGKTIEKEVVEAEATVKFTFRVPEKNIEIVRTVKSSHKAYKNPATTRGDAMKSALSKAWTLAAQSFGICADLDKDPDEPIIDEERQSKTSGAPKKDFIEVEEVKDDLGF